MHCVNISTDAGELIYLLRTKKKEKLGGNLDNF